MCSLQLLHHSDVPRPVWGIFSLWEPAGGRARGSRCVNILKRCVNRGTNDMTYPRARTLVWHSILLSRECSTGFVCVCERAVIYERGHIYSRSPDVSNAKYLYTKRLNVTEWDQISDECSLETNIHSCEILFDCFESTVPWTTAHRMPLKKEIAF